VPRISFTPSLHRHLATPPLEVPGENVAEILGQAFVQYPGLRGYLLDDQGRLRRHVAIFVDGRRIADPANFTDPVAPRGEVYVVQALSGGAGRPPQESPP
jgi:sulfur-carrier protein